MLIFVSTIAHRSGPNPTAHRRAATFGTYHFELDQPDMRDRYYRHRREVFPPDHGTLSIDSSYFAGQRTLTDE
jgi:hypothetical protein